jgi:hypothetical protein
VRARAGLSSRTGLGVPSAPQDVLFAGWLICVQRECSFHHTKRGGRMRFRDKVVIATGMWRVVGGQAVGQ